jgi:hypothetical protein
MGFIAPFVPLISSLLGLGGAALGVSSAENQQGNNNRATSQQLATTQQEQAQQAQQFGAQKDIMSQLAPFLQQFLQQGSPFLRQIQQASSEQTAKQYNEASGQAAERNRASGQGYAPSGSTTAMFGVLGRVEAGQQSTNYLQNLLNNESKSFQAASGLLQEQGNFKPGGVQSPEGVYGQPGYTSPSNAIGAAGTALGNVFSNLPGKGSGDFSNLPLSQNQLPAQPTPQNLPGPTLQMPQFSPAGFN